MQALLVLRVVVVLLEDLEVRLVDLLILLDLVSMQELIIQKRVKIILMGL
jgi:hypothetical protein